MKAATHRKLAPGTKRKSLCCCTRARLLWALRNEDIQRLVCRHASPVRASVCICFICRLLDLLAGKATHARTSSLDEDASKQHTEHYLHQRILARTKCFSSVWTQRQTHRRQGFSSRDTVSYCLLLCSNRTHYKCVSGFSVAIKILCINSHYITAETLDKYVVSKSDLLKIIFLTIAQC